jgi:hypothetical protein
VSNQNAKHSHCNTNSNSVSSKKKKNKGNSNNCSQQQNNPSSITATKSQHSTAKNTTSLKLSSGSNSSYAPFVGGKQQTKSSMSQQQQSSSAVIVNHAANDVLSMMSPLSHVPSVNQLTTATAIQINNVINTISSAGKTLPVSSSVATQRLKSEATLQTASSQSFSLENLKLPPGITITKVDGPTVAALRKSQLKPSDSSKSTPFVTSSHSSTTVISGPAAAVSSSRLGGFGGGGSISQGISGSNVIVVDTVKMKEELQAVTMNGGDPNHSKKKNKKRNKNQNNAGSTNVVNGNSSGQLHRQQQVGNGVTANQVNGKDMNGTGGKSQNSQSSTSVRIQPNVYPLLTKSNLRPQTIAMNATQLAQPAIIKVNGSMVTIRNPALQHAMATSSRFPQQGNGHAEILVNGEMPTTKPGNKPGKKPANSAATNGIAGVKGKENGGSVPPRFTNSDSVMLRNRLAPHVEYNGLSSIPGLHISKVNSPVGRVEESGIAVRGSANMLPPRMRIQQQSPPSRMTEVRKVNHNHVSARHEGLPSQHASAARSAIREAMAATIAASDAKKKKKKKKGTGPQGHCDDWNLVGKFCLQVCCSLYNILGYDES